MNSAAARPADSSPAPQPVPASPVRHVLVFAHTPPPHHGQSAMVQLMLDLLQPGGEPPAGSRLRLWHVNARLSASIAEVGAFRPGKLLTLCGHCLRAVRLGRQVGAHIFYYVPSPPARVPLWRDWLVMAWCRPFFPRLVFHWHAGGLANWLQTRATAFERALTLRLLGRHDLSLVLRPFHRRDAEYLGARGVEIMPNGLPDPCPDFETTVLPARRAAAAARRRAVKAKSGAGGEPVLVRVLFLSWLRPEKGVFDALEAVALACRRLAGTGVRLELVVAGDFASPAVRAAFEQRVAAPDLAGPPPMVRSVGFVSGTAKDRLWREVDCLCFPTRLPEGFPVTLAEAMAYGLPVLCSDAYGLPEILPPGYPGMFAAGRPEELAARLVEWLDRDYDPALRHWYLTHYTAERFAERMRAALSAL